MTVEENYPEGFVDPDPPDEAPATAAPPNPLQQAFAGLGSNTSDPTDLTQASAEDVGMVQRIIQAVTPFAKAKCVFAFRPGSTWKDGDTFRVLVTTKKVSALVTESKDEVAAKVAASPQGGELYFNGSRYRKYDNVKDSNVTKDITITKGGAEMYFRFPSGDNTDNYVAVYKQVQPDGAGAGLFWAYLASERVNKRPCTFYIEDQKFDETKLYDITGASPDVEVVLYGAKK
eukprot:TRINITY_DN745_c0_g1_i1.p1 TRINITY_DN745_c0_g1~~TRINITY_DN745_c0_g1_i1.p1  ORF type:complete len:231 (+),score=70.94 TRINITY_DN745_c0_g1_i1:192-884(+)